MNSLRRASIGCVALVLAGCAGTPGPSGTVTEKHHYPAHVKTTYTGDCRPELVGDDRPQPSGCERKVKSYPELWELCLRSGEAVTCWYVTESNERNATVGGHYELDTCCADDPHPSATNEWDGPS
jgi:hypothetical protein